MFNLLKKERKENTQRSKNDLKKFFLKMVYFAFNTTVLKTNLFLNIEYEI